LTVGVSGHGAERRLLVQALKQMGMEVKGEDTLPRFEVSQNGKQLLIQDETGKLLTAEESLLLTVFLLLEKGEREIALPSSAPAAAGRLAEHYSGAILSLGRDGTKARELAEEQLCLQDGIFAACLLCRRLAQTGETISHLTQQLPACVMRQAEIELSAGRGHAMERFAQEFPQAESTGDGLRIKMGSGSVFIAPRSRLSALKISAEAGNAEIAHELCDFISNRARELDSL
jgi:hypothetical protein